MEQDKIRVKLVLRDTRQQDWLKKETQNEVRRIDLETWPSFADIKTKVLSEFYGHDLKHRESVYKIKYTDKDGDTVTVDNDKNWDIALREAADGQVLKLIIHAYDRY